MPKDFSFAEITGMDKQVTLNRKQRRQLGIRNNKFKKYLTRV